MQLASQQLSAMSPADQAAFNRLVDNAQSPQEAAYLRKALGAGNTLDQISSFAKVINGKDPSWLSSKLNPQLNDPNTIPGEPNQKVLSYDGSPASSLEDIYDQGQYGDCIAASTVVAKLNADPVQTLGVTTGLGPDAIGGAKAGDDSPAAMQSRLQNLYLQNYHESQIGHERQTDDREDHDGDQIGARPRNNRTNEDVFIYYAR